MSQENRNYFVTLCLLLPGLGETAMPLSIGEAMGAKTVPNPNCLPSHLPPQTLILFSARTKKPYCPPIHPSIHPSIHHATLLTSLIFFCPPHSPSPLPLPLLQGKRNGSQGLLLVIIIEKFSAEADSDAAGRSTGEGH
jgi:hypothetical protein